MENRLQSIEIALNNELKERDFYLEHSKRTTNPVGKQMFESIAGDEDEHYQRLKELHGQLSEKGTWPEMLSVSDTTAGHVLDNVKGLVDETSSADADDKKAIEIAIDFESKGFAFYTKLAETADTPKEKSFFEHLAAIEKEHLLSLKDTLLFLEDPKSWYEEHEKPHFES